MTESDDQNSVWRCTNCHHIEPRTDKHDRCPVCGAEAEKLVPHEITKINGSKTVINLKARFVAESQTRLRNMAFVMKAEQEGYPQAVVLVINPDGCESSI